MKYIRIGIKEDTYWQLLQAKGQYQAKSWDELFRILLARQDSFGTDLLSSETPIAKIVYTTKELKEDEGI